MSSLNNNKRVCAVRPDAVIHRHDCVSLLGLNVLLHPHGARQVVYAGPMVGIHECRCGQNLPPITHILDEEFTDEQS